MVAGEHDAVVIELVGQATQLSREPIAVGHQVERSDAPPLAPI